MAASSPKTLLEQGHQLKYLPRSVPPAPERPERTDRQYEGFSPRRAATGASGCPSCGGWNWTPTDHLTRQLPGLKDCLGLQTAGDGAQATPAGIGLQEDYVDMGNDR